ncbi:uncharacterized protein A4U43_C03F20480 [Asparagus officinalis]|uniref:C2H2-type domain-containing protein n=1 Tax=Asparagus officinalis TaxID=4686 RepID=A0A5P1FGT1_ASPOF|nr:zinc finger protein ZAT1-like [Asparagus officinalis]ONK75780.1 uncharacterized protein A4U43_C03F20480 [Asparagus officinalis]
MDQDRKLQCQFCPKFFPCARSLDDHMSIHVPPLAAAGYGLRGKPKRTTSFGDLQCAENSEGRMKSHSQRTQGAKEEDDERSLSKKQRRISSEYPKEKVDGAIALMKLSRDKRKRGNGAPEYSDENPAKHQELSFEDEDDDSLKRRRRKKKSGSNGLEADGDRDEAEGLGHECSICGRLFRSGQALGGHKRSHSSKVAPKIVDHDADLGGQ